MGRKRSRLQKVLFSGIVTPEDWDEHQSLCHVSLVTEDSQRYEVHDDATGRELLDYPWENVRIWGTLDHDLSTSGPVLRVERFEPLDEDVDDADEEHPSDELSF